MPTGHVMSKHREVSHTAYIYTQHSYNNTSLFQLSLLFRRYFVLWSLRAVNFFVTIHLHTCRFRLLDLLWIMVVVIFFYCNWLTISSQLGMKMANIGMFNHVFVLTAVINWTAALCAVCVHNQQFSNLTHWSCLRTFVTH